MDLIKIEPDHMKDLDTFVPQIFTDKINKEVNRQLNELVEKGILKVMVCDHHWPKNVHRFEMKVDNGGMAMGLWFETTCGGCNATISPSGWEKVT